MLRAAVVATLLLGACAPEAPPPPAVRPVLFARVAIGGAQDLAVFAGEVKPRHEADLAFRIAGKLVERSVEVGTVVRRGQVLARLDPADVGLQAQAQAAAVAAAQTEDAFARAEYARYENLQKQGFVSASALDQKRSAMNAAEARLAQARAMLAVTRNQAAYATLAAPADGVITVVAAEAGQVVAAGQPVLKLAQTSEREVAIAVPEHRLGELRAAKALAVATWADPGKRYAARVREIAPAVDPVTRTFAVRVAVADADAALAWGMTANVVLVGEAAPAALVPLPAVYHAPDGAPAVWVFDPATGKVALRAVTIAAFRENGATVTHGLRDGEWIVAAGANKLTQGQVVRPYDAANAPVPSASAAPLAAERR